MRITTFFYEYYDIFTILDFKKKEINMCVYKTITPLREKYTRVSLVQPICVKSIHFYIESDGTFWYCFGRSR